MQEKEAEDIVKRIRALPAEVQRGVCWLIQNIELADELCKGEKMTQEETNQFVKSTREKKDFIGLVLILYKHAKDALK